MLNRLQARVAPISSQQVSPPSKEPQASFSSIRALLSGIDMAVSDDGRVGMNDKSALFELADATDMPEARSLVQTLADAGEKVSRVTRSNGRVKGTGYVDVIHKLTIGPGGGFNADQPEVIRGRPNGAGDSAGSLDVISLGQGGSIEFGLGRAVKRGITLYGNGFVAADGTRSGDRARVEAFDSVKKRWIALPGVAEDKPVRISPSNSIRPSSAASGGDRFSFAGSDLTPGAPVRRFRVTDLSKSPGPGVTGGFDIDGAHGF